MKHELQIAVCLERRLVAVQLVQGGRVVAEKWLTQDEALEFGADVFHFADVVIEEAVNASP